MRWYVAHERHRDFLSAPHDETEDQRYMRTAYPFKKNKELQLLKKIIRPIDAPAFSNLTKEYCTAFNLATPDDPSVYYSSYAACTTLGPFAPLSFSSYIVTGKEGPNDGLVSLKSAEWGEFQGVVDCDHWELVPTKLRLIQIGSKAFDPTLFYLTVVRDLALKGF